MKLEYVPLVRVQRAIYDLPRGPERFQRYLAAMTGGGAEMELPLMRMNPMGKDGASATVDALLALDADQLATEATTAAAARLAGVRGELRVALVVADDAEGGWTNRALAEFDHCFVAEGELKRGWAVALIWSSETPTAATVRARIDEAIYRACHRRRFGSPATLRRMIEQEGRAARFAGATPAPPVDLDQAAIAAGLSPHLDSAHLPTLIACLYGDDAARAVGYPALALPAWAGIRLAKTWTGGAKALPAALLFEGSPTSRRGGTPDQ